MADRAREDFARCVSRKLGESQSKDVKTDDLQGGWHSKKMLAWSFSTQLGVCICPGSLRWLVFNCATAQPTPSLSVAERRQFVIPIWAVLA